MARKEYSEATKDSVLAALMAGQSVNQVAKKYQIPKGTVSSWQKRAQETLDPIRRDAAQELAGDEATSEIGHLFATYLTTTLLSLISIAKVLGDQEYLKTQGVEGNAMAFGVLTDKVVRVTEAMNRAGSESETAEN